MPPSRRSVAVSLQPPVAVQVNPPSDRQSNSGKWILVAIIAILAYLHIQNRGVGPSPSPRPDDKVAPDPAPKPDEKKVAKKVEGRAIFLCPRFPMSAEANQVIFDAEKYRAEVGKDKFNFINPDAEKDTSEPVLKAIETCKKLGKSPPCVLWVPHSGPASVFDWPKTFEEFKAMASK